MSSAMTTRMFGFCCCPCCAEAGPLVIAMALHVTTRALRINRDRFMVASHGWRPPGSKPQPAQVTTRRQSAALHIDLNQPRAASGARGGIPCRCRVSALPLECGQSRTEEYVPLDNAFDVLVMACLLPRRSRGWIRFRPTHPTTSCVARRAKHPRNGSNPWMRKYSALPNF
jgi:hypothetical protein